MVLLSTRNYGFIDQKVPSLNQFNYVVCEVTTTEGDILVDATGKLLQFDMLPPRCFNQFGFLVGTGRFGWAPVQPRLRAKVLFDATVTFTESGGLTGKLKSFKDGYAAYDVRKKYSERILRHDCSKEGLKHCVEENLTRTHFVIPRRIRLHIVIIIMTYGLRILEKKATP